MKITFHTSASVVIEDNDVKILTDPWFVDGEFYGSWAHYPKYEFNPSDFDDIDYIYISHIHPDHFSSKTLEILNSKIPILIHNFHFKFLSERIKKLGYKVIELNHNERKHLKNQVHMRILAADNCDPKICYKYFGCGIAEKTFGSTSIDTMCAIDNNEEVLINTNDCPFDLGKTSADLLKSEYDKINFLLVGYSSATAYPQCFTLSKSDLSTSRKKIISSYLSNAESYVKLFEPEFFMPFAGRYVISGKNFKLNEKKATPELEDALKYFNNSRKITQKNSCILLNAKEYFDITTGKVSKEYVPINLKNKEEYIYKILSLKKYDYENDPIPELRDILELIPKSYERFEKIRKQLNFSSNTKIIIKSFDDLILSISANGTGYEINKYSNGFEENFLEIKLEPKLFFRLLKGPKFAHWNNAEIGSHLSFRRNPNIYERGLFYCLNFFYS